MHAGVQVGSAGRAQQHRTVRVDQHLARRRRPGILRHHALRRIRHAAGVPADE